MSKLSRKQRYQDLRDKLDEDTTQAASVSISESMTLLRPYGNIDHLSSHAARPIHSHQQPTAKAQLQRLPKSKVMNDLLGEVKQYNIDNGNRYEDDTQINILRTLESSTEQLRRSRHIVEMEVEEKQGSTMRMDRTAAGSTPMKRLSRSAAKTPENPPLEKQMTEEKIVLTSDDIRADYNSNAKLPAVKEEEAQPAAKKKTSLFSRRRKKEQELDESIMQDSALILPDENEEEKPVKASGKTNDGLSLLFEDPFVVDEDEADDDEEEDVKKSSVHAPALNSQNILIFVLVILLLCSLGLTFFILKKSGIL